MSVGLWNTLELLADGRGAVLAEWQLLAGDDVATVGAYLRPTGQLAKDYPCLAQPDCGCRHELEKLDEQRFIVRCQCEMGECPPVRLAPSDLIIHELDVLRFGRAVGEALGFETADNREALRTAPKVWPVGTYAVTQSPVYLAICPDEAQLLNNLEAVAVSRREPFILLAPTAELRSEAVGVWLERQRCAFIPLARCLTPDGAAKFRMTRSIEPNLERFKAGLAEGPGLVRTVEKIGRDLDAVARGTYELRRENNELRRLHAEGYFKFALRVEADDFRAFAVIMALGNRKQAADFLKVPHRSFYDRVDQWASRGREYRLLSRFIEWRKRSSRHLKVRLDESLQSGETGGGENPETLRDVLEGMKSADNGSYPQLLTDILGALQNQNAANWAKVRDEVVGIIQEELPQ